jgi:hypothetical protein
LLIDQETERRPGPTWAVEPFKKVTATVLIEGTEENTEIYSGLWVSQPKFECGISEIQRPSHSSSG